MTLGDAEPHQIVRRCEHDREGERAANDQLVWLDGGLAGALGCQQRQMHGRHVAGLTDDAGLGLIADRER
jgi:hypothetical protein